MTKLPSEPLCHICNASATLEQAIEAGWSPSYWRGESEIGEPTCAECLAKYLRFNEEFGDWELPDDKGRPIQISVNGETVEGKITYLRFNDIRVEITSPFADVSKALHIAYFALPYFQYARNDSLTPHGRQTAEQLLKEIYEECVFCEANEEELVLECENVLTEGPWSRFRTAIARCDFASNWHLLPIFVLVFCLTDWELVRVAQDRIEEKFGRKLPEELVRRLLARARWD
jgi:hypothetical protein